MWIIKLGKEMKTKHMILLLPALIPVLAGAQDTLSLDRCREMALANNHKVEIASLSEQKALSDVKVYRANFLPEFAISGGYMFTNSDISLTLPTITIPGGIVPPIELGNYGIELNNTWFAGVGAQQPIYMGGKVRSAYKMSRIGAEMAGHNKELTRTEVLVAVDEAYWLHIRAKELRTAAQKYVEVIDELYRNVGNAESVGMASRNDILKVEVKRNEALLQLKRADNGVELSMMSLCHMVGLPLDSRIAVPDGFDDGTPEMVWTGDVTERPEYAMLDGQARLKEQQVKLIRSDFLPQVGVGAQYGYAQGLKTSGGNRLMDNDAVSAMFTASIPLYHWGEGRGKVKSAKTETLIARVQMDEMVQKMELELRQARYSWDEAMLETRLTENSLEQAEENLRVSRDHYEAGMETLANYLEAQTSWQKASSDHVNARAALRLSETQYLKAAGML